LKKSIGKKKLSRTFSLALATTGGLTHSNELKREDFRQEKMKLNVVNYSGK